MLPLQRRESCSTVKVVRVTTSSSSGLRGTSTGKWNTFLNIATDLDISKFRTDLKITKFRTYLNFTKFRTDLKITKFRTDLNITKFKTDLNITKFRKDLKWMNFSIDATQDNGRIGRLINHSRDSANSVVRSVKIGEIARLCLFANQDISAGEEITYDYNDRRQDVLKSFPWLAK